MLFPQHRSRSNNNVPGFYGLSSWLYVETAKIMFIFTCQDLISAFGRALTKHARQQKKRIFLFFRFVALKVILFFFLLSNSAAYVWLLVLKHFLVKTQFVENVTRIFIKNGLTYKILANCVKNLIFNANLLHVISAWCNKLENGIKH